MCLAVPMKIVKIDGMYAVAESKGVTTDVNISLVPDIRVNDKVLVHAGFAIEHLDDNDAKDIEAAWDEYYAVLEKEKKQ